jgi:hypothetical protein
LSAGLAGADSDAWLSVDAAVVEVSVDGFAAADESDDGFFA